MQRFEITLDGAALPGEFATENEARASLAKVQHDNPGKKAAIRPKANDTAPAVPATGHAAQGTPGNPPGADQRKVGQSAPVPADVVAPARQGESDTRDIRPADLKR